MSDYLEDNPSEVKNAAYYRRQMKELERENAELKQQITLLSGVFSREEELQAHITELKRIIDDSKNIPDGMVLVPIALISRIKDCDDRSDEGFACWEELNIIYEHGIESINKGAVNV